MKNSAIIRIILFSLAIVILGGVLMSVITIGRIAEKLGDSDELDKMNIPAFLEGIIDEDSEDVIVVSGSGKSAVFAPDEVDSLEIEWAAGSIVIERGNTDSITISEDAVSKEKYEMEISRSGKTVKIQFCKDSIDHIGITGIKSVSKNLVITIPQAWEMEELEVDAASADVFISDMNIRTADFNMASGEIQMKNCNVNTVDLDTASGDVEFSGTLNALECDAASANCVVKVFNVPSRINMSSASGNLELYLPEDCGFTCNMETLSGSFSSDFSASGLDGKYIYGNGECQIDIEAMSGNITIRKN